MGRRGPLPKQKDEHGRAIAGTVAVSHTFAPPSVPAGAAPPAPEGLHPAAAEAWALFWSSSAAVWVDRGAHMSRLYRWVRDLDTYHRILDDLTPREGKAVSRGTARGAPIGVVDPKRPWLGRGSRAQITVHPNAELLNQLEQRIHRTEVEFGMTPYSQVRLAGAGVQGALTAEQLNRMLDERREQHPEDQASEPWAQGLAPAR